MARPGADASRLVAKKRPILGSPQSTFHQDRAYIAGLTPLSAESEVFCCPSASKFAGSSHRSKAALRVGHSESTSRTRPYRGCVL